MISFDASDKAPDLTNTNAYQFRSLLSLQLRYSLPLLLGSYIITQALLPYTGLCQDSAESLAPWTREIYLGLGIAFFALEIGTMLRSDRVSALKSETRAVVWASRALHCVSGSSCLLTYAFRWGGVCRDSLGVWSAAAQWPEWTCTVPFLVYLSIAVEPKAALTKADWAKIICAALTILSGVFLIMVPREYLHVMPAAIFVAGCATMYYSFASPTSCGNGRTGSAQMLSKQPAGAAASNPFAGQLQSSQHVNPLRTDGFGTGGATTVQQDHTRSHQPDIVRLKASLSYNLMFLLFVLNPWIPFAYMLGALGLVSPSMNIALFALLGCAIKLSFVSVLTEVHLHNLLIDDMYRASEQEAIVHATRRSFLRKIFHEVRVPLSTITMGLSLLPDDSDVLTGGSLDTLQTMGEAASFMADTLNDVLDMQKIEEGAVTVELSDFDITDMVKRVLKATHGRATSRQLEVSVHLPADFRPLVNADRFKIEHVLANLVSNAIKFTRLGSEIRISIAMSAEDVPPPFISSAHVVSTLDNTPRTPCSTRRLTDPPQREYRAYTFSVTDEGEGIAEEDMGRLFKSFSQIKPGEAQQGGGSGLGLSLAKEYVTLLGGTIGASSKVGEGSVFFFTLPLGLTFQDCNSSIGPPSAALGDLPSADELSQDVLDASDLAAPPVNESVRVPSPAPAPSAAISPSSGSVPRDTEVSPATTAPQPALSPSVKKAVFSRLRCLIVDDNMSNMKLMKAILKRAGVTADSAMHGAQAVEMIVESLTSAPAPAPSPVPVPSPVSSLSPVPAPSPIPAPPSASHSTPAAAMLSVMMSEAQAGNDARPLEESHNALASASAPALLDTLADSASAATPPAPSQPEAARRDSVVASAADLDNSFSLTVPDMSDIDFFSGSSGFTASAGGTGTSTDTGAGTGIGSLSVSSNSSASPLMDSPLRGLHSQSAPVFSERVPVVSSIGSNRFSRSESELQSALLASPPLPPLHPVARPALAVAQSVALPTQRLSPAAARLSSGPTILDSGEALSGSYQLVLMDNFMPVMDGLEATSRLRRLHGFTGIIVGVTGNVMEDDVASFLEAGADLVLPKPLYLRHIQSLLDHLAAYGCRSNPLKKFHFDDASCKIRSRH